MPTSTTRISHSYVHVCTRMYTYENKTENIPVFPKVGGQAIEPRIERREVTGVSVGVRDVADTCARRDPPTHSQQTG